MINDKVMQIDEFMDVLKGWAEIYDTKYFSTIFRDDGYTQNDYDTMLLYLKSLYNDKDIRITYSKTYEKIPYIIQAIEKIRDNEWTINMAFDKL